ncbi:hypothetical protein CPB83DRAFT_897131 [Crepidotus variabilis]|uniref:Uncharacterized protein n=1 Tax=Crepidotus variabilis TaxID=179855 RepID=A0A9P6JLF6_9AGAR|nr:hypothetical protein CPB83DRAFT_897131 [Crepidotus variabilis]
MLDTCTPQHDWFNAFLTGGLCCGLVISYLPQHFRIIHAKSSEGFSPVFLLLGTASAASGMFNMITLQAPIVKCCRVVGLGSCLEMSAGVIQVGLQWLCFSIVFILYMIYYPIRLKYPEDCIEPHEQLLQSPYPKEPVRGSEWRLSIIVAWIAGIHFFVLAVTTAYLLHNAPPYPDGSIPLAISRWATFTGVTSALLAAIQYAPQLLHTYRTKLVGALSIPMMMIQTPGGILMVTSIVLRPGTNWTSWITFAVAATLQGCLLAMCISWKIRQHNLGIDDFGRRISSLFPPDSWNEATGDINAHEASQSPTPPVVDEDPVPGLITEPSENPVAVRTALADALEAAAETDLRSPNVGLPSAESETSERAPLLPRHSRTNSLKSNSEPKNGWMSWFGR